MKNFSYNHYSNEGEYLDGAIMQGHIEDKSGKTLAYCDKDFGEHLEATEKALHLLSEASIYGKGTKTQDRLMEEARNLRPDLFYDDGPGGSY